MEWPRNRPNGRSFVILHRVEGGCGRGEKGPSHIAAKTIICTRFHPPYTPSMSVYDLMETRLSSLQNSEITKARKSECDSHSAFSRMLFYMAIGICTGIVKIIFNVTIQPILLYFHCRKKIIDLINVVSSCNYLIEIIVGIW